MIAKLLVAFALIGLSVIMSSQPAFFSDVERLQVLRYWSDQGRYSVSAPSKALVEGPWQVRLTPQGSLWLWNYDRARGLGKTPPGQTPPPRNAEEKQWDAWIDQKIAFDRCTAERNAQLANEKALGKRLRGPLPAIPAKPGVIPAKLAALVGNPPPFAAVVAPLQHTITFEDGLKLDYQDHPVMRPRYAYYRFENGVMHGGIPVKNCPAEQLDELFLKAGLSPSEGRVFRAVSLLEGGFDSVNTYDTGYVSVGFIQFAALAEGGGSLGKVLLRQKQENLQAFQKDFRRFGIDVGPDGKLVVLDPSTGCMLTGSEANLKIIEDKRLIAVFQRAGQLSQPFRIAQLQVAKQLYYPKDEQITLQVGKDTWRIPVGEIVRSEAGLAILMDRKVNTGKLDPLPQILTSLIQEHKLKNARELTLYEEQLVARLVYRKDYLADATLTKPSQSTDLTARGGKTSREKKKKSNGTSP